MKRLRCGVPWSLSVLLACGVPESEGPLAWEELSRVDAEPAATAEADSALPDAALPLDAAQQEHDAELPSHQDAQIMRTDAAVVVAPDAGSVSKLDAFMGAPAYASKSVATSAKQRMAGTGLSPTKAPCLGCHNGQSKAPAWFAGGSVFRDLNASQAAPDLEVRIVDMASARVYTAHTDEDGNFFLPRPSEASSGPYLIGVRDGNNARSMPLLQRGLDCNGSACHGGAQGPIHLP
jgi:hypothetical protein